MRSATGGVLTAEGWGKGLSTTTTAAPASVGPSSLGIVCSRRHRRLGVRPLLVPLGPPGTASSGQNTGFLLPRQWGTSPATTQQPPGAGGGVPATEDQP